MADSSYTFFFSQIGKQNLKGETTFQGLQRVGSLIEVRTKENLMSRTPVIPHPFMNHESEMVRKTQPQGKEHITGDRHSPSAFAVHVLISESATEWAVPEPEKPICVGKTLVCPQRQPLTEKKIQTLPLTQTLQNSISYSVSTTTLNPPASWDYICELTKAPSLN